MNNKAIPTYQFSSKYLADIPFQIIQFADLPQVATKPSPHRRTFYEIFWIKAGSGIHHIDFETWEITPNTIHFIKPRQVTYWEIQEDISGYAILFTPEFLTTNVFDKSLPHTLSPNTTKDSPLIHISEKYQNKVNDLCEQLLVEYTANDYGRFTLIQCLLTTFLIYTRRERKQDESTSLSTISDNIIMTYQQLIEQHFHEVKTIQSYAEMLNITSGHLRDITREKLGVTPSELLNKRVILECKRLLTHSNKTIAEIAHQLQFDDPSYFTRFFKRETGQTPTAFRQYIREKYQHPRE